LAGSALFSIEGTLTVTHCAPEKALIGSWTSMTSGKFREALEKALGECGRLGALCWIVDLTGDPGVPSQADLAWIQTVAANLAKRNRIRAVINVHGASSIATMGAKRWSKSASDAGLSTFDCASIADALALAAEVASGKAA